jgi:RNA polymerase sigma-70 factor (ECF subfamily)
MPSEDATATLVARASSGDATAMEALLARHLPGLRAYVRLRAGPKVRAQESCSDLVQSVCRDVLGNLNGFRYEGEAAFRGFLCKAALRKIADRAEHWGAQRRDVAREVRIDRGDHSADEALLELYRRSGTPSEAASARETLDRIEAAFDALPDDKREAVVLERILGLPREEVARQMGRTPDAVRHLLFRGLAELSRRLEPQRGGAG